MMSIDLLSVFSALGAMAISCATLGCAPQQPLRVHITLEHRLVAGRQDVAFPLFRVRNRRRYDVWVTGISGTLERSLKYSIRQKTSGKLIGSRFPVAEPGGGMGLVPEQRQLLLAAGAEVGRCVELFLARSDKYDTTLHLIDKDFGVWRNCPGREPDEEFSLSRDVVFKGYVPLRFLHGIE